MKYKSFNRKWILHVRESGEDMKKLQFIYFLIFVSLILVSCPINISEKGEMILTGPCGETAENYDEIVEIEGKKYYTLYSNYEKDYYFDYNKANGYYPGHPQYEKFSIDNPPFEVTGNRELFDKIRYKFWNTWLEDGSYWTHSPQSNRKIEIDETGTIKYLYINLNGPLEPNYQTIRINQSEPSYIGAGGDMFRFYFAYCKPNELYSEYDGSNFKLTN